MIPLDDFIKCIDDTVPGAAILTAIPRAMPARIPSIPSEETPNTTTAQVPSSAEKVNVRLPKTMEEYVSDYKASTAE